MPRIKHITRCQDGSLQREEDVPFLVEWPVLDDLSPLVMQPIVGEVTSRLGGPQMKLKMLRGWCHPKPQAKYEQLGHPDLLDSEMSSIETISDVHNCCNEGARDANMEG